MENQDIGIKFCSNCGKAVEQSQNFCKNCGAQLLNINIQNNRLPSLKVKSLDFFKKNKKVIIIISVLICLIMIISLVLKNSLNSYEELALSRTEYLIDHMKDPDSFKLQSDIIYVKLNSEIEEYNNKDVLFIEYSAKNGYGGNVKSVACFFDGKYVDLDDELEKVYESDYNSLDEYIEAAEKALDDYALVFNMKEYLLDWNLSGSGSDSFSMTYVISAKKIAEKAKCEYSE